MPTPTTDPVAELAQSDQEDTQNLQNIVGEHQVQQEQDQAQANINAAPQLAQDKANIASEQAGYGASAAADTVSDVEHRVAQIPEGAVAGVVQAAGEATKGAVDAGAFLMNHTAMGWATQAMEAIDPSIKASAQRQLDTLQQLPMKVADALTPTVDTAGGEAVKGVTQFAAGFIPILRAADGVEALEGTGMAAKLVRASVASGVTQATVFNPDDPRVSNLIQSVPSLKNPITELLASQPGDNEALGRLKNAIEGSTLGALGDAAVDGVTSIFRAMRATGALADTTKAILNAEPTPVESAPVPEDTTPAGEVKLPGEPAGTIPGPQAAPAAEPDVATGAPQSPLQAPPVEPEATPEAAPKAPVATPQSVATDAFKVAPEQAQKVLGYMTDGRYSEIPGVLEDTHRTIPWDTLSDGANLKGLFNAVEGTFGSMIREGAGVGPVPQATIVQMAKDLGGNVSEVSKLFADTSNLAPRITAGYNIMVASARQLKDLADTARPLLGSPAGNQAVVAFQKQLELHAAILGQVRQSSAEIGRALWAHRQLKASSDVALAGINDLGDSLLGPGAVKKFLKRVGGGSLADVNAAADRARGGKFTGVIKEIAQGGMLMHPSTQLSNIVGNAYKAIQAPFERTLAGVIGNVRGVLMPNTEHATIRAAIAHAGGMVDGLRDSFPLFVKALKEEPTVNTAGRPISRYINAHTEGLSGPALTGAQAINITGKVIRYSGRFMGAIDNLNMGIGYQGDLAARSYTQAATEADTKGLTGDARESFMAPRIEELKLNAAYVKAGGAAKLGADRQLAEGMHAHAFDAGLYQSFQEAARTKLGSHIADGLNSAPLLKLLIAPFVHRPLNMLRQGLMDYTPLGLANDATQEALKGANADTDLALARMTIGTSAAVYGYHLAARGSLTGDRLGYENTQSLDGIPTNAIQKDGRWFTYNRIDPVGMWLGIAADIHEQMNRVYDPNNSDTSNDLATLARIGTQTVGSVAMDKSFMQSVDQVIEWMGEKNPERAAVLGQRVLDSNAFKFVPLSGALDTAAEALDPTPRATGGTGLGALWDSVKARLPGLSKDQPPRRDILGRPMVKPGGTTAWWNPFGGSPASSDPLDQKLAEVATQIRPPSRVVDGIELTAQQYDQVLTTSTQTKLFNGMNLEDKLRQLTTSYEWTKYDNTDDHGLAAHADMVRGLINGAYDYGKQTFQKNNPTFAAAQQQRYMQEAKHFQVQ